MRDLVVLVFLILCIGAAVRKPWHGVLSLAIFSYMNPHAFAWGFVRNLPAFQILFLVVAVATLFTKEKQNLPKDWRIPTFFLLWFYFLITTTQAYFPELAWTKLIFVSKVYLPFIFTLTLINTRKKLYYLIVTIGLSIGLIGAKGGIFAVLSGFNHRVYGPPGTQFYENNAFGIAILIAIPLVLIFYHETKNKWYKYGVACTIPLMVASALSSWSRGAILTLAVLGITLLWHSKHKLLLIPIMLIAMYFSTDYLPEEWFNRMQTIETHKQDASAMSRIKIWKDGWNHTLRHPFAGAGFEGWRWVGDRDWHSAYVEMFSEHGFIAFGLWLSLIIGSVVSLTRLPKLTKDIEGMEWVTNYCFMLRTSIICYMSGTVFLGLSYWDLIYHLIFISVLIKQFAVQELAEKTGSAIINRHLLYSDFSATNSTKEVFRELDHKSHRPF